MKDPHRKVKIDYSVLCELLDVYSYAKDCSMTIKYVSPYGDVYSRQVSMDTIKKANNILNNS